MLYPHQMHLGDDRPSLPSDSKQHCTMLRELHTRTRQLLLLHFCNSFVREWMYAPKPSLRCTISSAGPEVASVEVCPGRLLSCCVKLTYAFSFRFFIVQRYLRGKDSTIACCKPSPIHYLYRSTLDSELCVNENVFEFIPSIC